MTFESLRCFCAIVEHDTFRAAAEHVHRSQPAVSQQLKALETELGQTLIDRRAGRPTPVGQRVHERAKQILLAAESLSREVADFDESAVRELRVGTSDTTALYALPRHVRQFSRVMPQTRLVLISRSSEAITQQVLQGDLDLGVVTLPQDHRELEEEKLFDQQLVLVAPFKHPLAAKSRVRLAEIKGLPLLLIDEHTQTGALLHRHFENSAFEPRAVLDSGSFEVIKRYIKEGVGLSFLPRNVITPNDRGLATITVPGLPKVPIGAVWRKGAYRSRAERAFLDLLRGG